MDVAGSVRSFFDALLQRLTLREKAPPPHSALPEFGLRGLRKAAYITSEGMIMGEAFMPDERTAQKRSDAAVESSVNWDDDEKALGFSLGQRPQAEFGIARFMVAEVVRISQLPMVSSRVWAERDALPDNRYHGNLVFAKGLPKPTMRAIAATLALASELHRRGD